MPLRRATERVLFAAIFAVFVTSMALTVLALATRPEIRVAAPLAWISLGLFVQHMTGERPTRGSILFAGLFALPIVATVVAVYEASQRWGLSGGWATAIVAAVVALFVVVFFRMLIASGSADYPYDE